MHFLFPGTDGILFCCVCFRKNAAVFASAGLLGNYVKVIMVSTEGVGEGGREGKVKPQLITR